MPNVLIILLLSALIAFAVLRTVRRARKGGGCCGEKQGPVKRVSVRDRNRAHYPYELTLPIGGMTCEQCARRVENALNALPDTWATVRLDTATARIRTKQPPDEAALRVAVSSAGYSAG